MKTILVILICVVGFGDARCATNVSPLASFLAASGDSQTAAGTSWFSALTNASSCVGFGATGWAGYTNGAHSGDGRIDIDNRYTNEFRPYTNRWPALTTIFTLNGGANDDFHSDTNRWLTNALSYSNQIVRAQNDHWLVVHFNLMPRGGYVGGVSPIGWSNAIYRQNWSNYNAWCASSNNPANWKMDWASLVPPSTLGDTNYWQEASPDELHITLWANRLVATNLALLLTTNTVSSGGNTNISLRLLGNQTVRGNFIFR